MISKQIRSPGLRINTRYSDEPLEQKRAKAMTKAELTEFLHAVPDQHRTLFTLLAETGVRISEVLGLNVSDSAFGAKPTLKVRRQYYNARRELPLSPQSAQALWRICANRSEDEPLFATRTGSRYLDGNLRRDALIPAARAAGVEWVGFHTLRHTCASLLFDQGRNIAQVSTWLGHSDAAFTLSRYVHLMDEGVGDALSLDGIAAAAADTLSESPPKDNASASH